MTPGKLVQESFDSLWAKVHVLEVEGHQKNSDVFTYKPGALDCGKLSSTVW